MEVGALVAGELVLELDPLGAPVEVRAKWKWGGWNPTPMKPPERCLCVCDTVKVAGAMATWTALKKESNRDELRLELDPHDLGTCESQGQHPKSGRNPEKPLRASGCCAASNLQPLSARGCRHGLLEDDAKDGC